MITNGSPSPQREPAGGPGPPREDRRSRAKAVARPVVRRARGVTAWGKQKYTGSSAEYLYTRLTALDFINQGMLFAATLLLCAVPFLIVVASLGGKSAAHGISLRMGLNKQAASVFGHLFTSPSATEAAVVGSTSMVFFVVGGIAVASTLQVLYERVFAVDHRGAKGLPRQLIWLAVTVGLGFLGGWAGSAVRYASPIAWVAGSLAWFIGFWWVPIWLLLAGRVPWRKLFPCACATGAFWVGMQVVFSFFVSGMVISENKEYGPIGSISALMSFLIAIGVVVILGAVVGLVWQERHLSFAAAFRKLRRPR